MNYLIHNESDLSVLDCRDMAMEIFDSINLYLMAHPIMIDQLEFVFRIKFWSLLGLALYFVLLPYRERKKEIRKEKTLSKTRGHFLA